MYLVSINLHNTAFTIVFQPQLPHWSFLIDGFTSICPFLLTITCFHQIHFQAFTVVHFSSYDIFSAVPPWSPLSKLNHPLTIFFNMPSFISFVITSITMANNSGDKADP